MSKLDYSTGCVNFRDVGECVNLLANRQVFPTGVILRGGKLESVLSIEQIGSPGTIINLRKGPDPEDRHFGADYWHFAISNDHEKYDTTDSTVRRWLNEIMACVATKVTRFPILFHCTSGKDRTGVVIATILAICGVERELIIQEYLWSDGEVNRTWIEGTLNGMTNLTHYFHYTDLVALRLKLLNGNTT